MYRHYSALFIAAVLAICVDSTSRADFVKLEDFEAHALGADVDTAGGWYSLDGAATNAVVADPAGGDNKVLVVQNDTTAVVRLHNSARPALNIPNTGRATLFLRFRFSGQKNYSFGLSDDAAAPAAGSFGAFEAQLNSNNPSNDIRARDADLFDRLSPASPLSPDRWYSLWMYVDNTTDTTTVYLDATTAPGSLTTALQANGAQTAFKFRNSGSALASNVLTSFLILTGTASGGDEGHLGKLYIDHLYIDSTGLNLVNPMPASTNTVVAGNDAIEVGVGGAISFDPVVNDTTAFGALNLSSITIVDEPEAGTVTVNPVTGKVVYRHTGVAAGLDSFQYRIANSAGITGTATVSVTVNGAMRLANQTLTLPQEPPAAGALQMVDALPGLTFPNAVAMTPVPGSPKSLIVASINGSVWMVPDTTVATPVRKELFSVATLSNFTRGRSIYGIVCHPDFANNGHIIVNYQGDKGGLPPDAQIPNMENTLADTNVSCALRVSRFTISPAHLGTLLTSTNTTAVNAAKAAVLATEYRYINLAEQALYHSINDCKFGPDGYLYVSFGDEGEQGEPYLNAQSITRDQYSAVIRIDVDRRPGNLEPNPHYSIPTDNGVARFKIPADNPYVGPNPAYNGTPIPAADVAKVRTEIWATGLRNPFKFDIDPVTGDLWVGDVGMDLWEEVTVLQKGDNAGWSFWEGNHERTNIPHRKPVAVHKAPIWEYPHSNGNNSVTGGLLYRGAALPSLTGKYLFGDFGSSRIWSLTPSQTPGGMPIVQELPSGGLSGIVDFEVDSHTGEILLLQHTSSGRVMRLVEREITDNTFPQLLSQTGAFADLATLTPNPGVVPYEPNLKFWSDHADKARWFVIKNTTDQMGYSRNGAWTFPAGMIFIKHFDMELNRSFPGTAKKRLETRFLVKNSAGSYGVSYRWNEEGTEAVLVPTTGVDFDLPIREGGNLNGDTVSGGTIIQQKWHIPSRSECLNCHNPAAGHALSVATQQLNKTGRLGTTDGNFLALLSQAGYLQGLDDNPGELPRFYRPNENSVSLEERVRSYLAVNCSYCHQPGGGANETWDGRGHFSVDQMGIIYGDPVSESYHDANDRFIIPGRKSDSLIFNRIQARGAIGDGTFNGYSQMPPLATNVVDAEGVALLSQWIDGHVNTAPAFSGSSVTQKTLPEDAALGTTIGTVTATDRDVRNGNADSAAISYAIVSGNNRNLFRIDPASGLITLNGPLDFEKKQQHILQVRASDNFTANPRFGTITVQVDVVDVQEDDPTTDANGNGIPDSWELQFGLPSAGPGADSDNDGLSNFFEYLRGSNPTQPNSSEGALRTLERVSPPAAGYIVEFRARNGVSLGEDFRLEFSPSLGGWTALSAGTYEIRSEEADGPGFSRIRVFVPNAETQIFFRLRTGP